MSNYPQWNVRLRHEWLSKPLKKKRFKKRQAKRIGLWEAWERKKKPEPPPEATDEAPAS